MRPPALARRWTPLPAPVRAALLGVILAAGATMSGCNVVGAMADTYERSASHTVKADYQGLGGKSFAVLVSADRNIQSQMPMLVEEFTRRVTDRLSARTNIPLPSGFIPASDALAFSYRNPTWHLRPPSKLAADIGDVDRVIMIEITEFRLHEPGNRYVWDGRASARISVADATSDEFVYERVVDVKYPDKEGYSQEELLEAQVMSALLVRLVDRSSWLFYDHEEKIRADY